jgi:hypothetical protein
MVQPCPLPPLYFPHVDLQFDEGDRLAVGCALRIAHFLDLAKIVEGQRTLAALR